MSVGIREVISESLKLRVSAVSHFQMASLLEVNRNKGESLMTICWTMALFCLVPTWQSGAWNDLFFSCHLAFLVQCLYSFSSHNWWTYKHLMNVEIEAMCYGNKCIMLLMIFKMNNQRTRSHSVRLHTIPIVIKEQLPFHFLHRLGWTMYSSWQNFTKTRKAFILQFLSWRNKLQTKDS